MRTSLSAFEATVSKHATLALAVLAAQSASVHEKAQEMQDAALETERQRVDAAERQRRMAAQEKRTTQRRLGRAVNGMMALAAIGSHPDIQRLLAAKAHLTAQRHRGMEHDESSAFLILYQANSEYDPQARDVVEITFFRDRLRIEYGVVLAHDVREIVIRYAATAEQIAILLEKIAGPPMGYSPTHYLDSGRWNKRDVFEGGSIAFQVLIECAASSRLETYLSHALADTERGSIAG